MNNDHGDLLAEMILLIATKFRKIRDKGGKPYVLHCLKVMHYCRTKDLELMMIALGHDVIEDTDTTYEDLRNLGFSERVIDGIRAMTKVPGETNREYLERLKANPDAVAVKLADLRHNSDIRRLKGVTEKDIKRMSKYHAMHLELQALSDQWESDSMAERRKSIGHA